ncbi:hypothetical protein C8Q79DRAFT_3105 [Trametes meyenii]|nr:hypothetical protein C8Q79DRAFT_3105 [Trametes meyenii]
MMHLLPFVIAAFAVAQSPFILCSVRFSLTRVPRCCHPRCGEAYHHNAHSRRHHGRHRPRPDGDSRAAHDDAHRVPHDGHYALHPDCDHLHTGARHHHRACHQDCRRARDCHDRDGDYDAPGRRDVVHRAPADDHGARERCRDHHRAAHHDADRAPHDNVLDHRSRYYLRGDLAFRLITT